LRCAQSVRGTQSATFTRSPCQHDFIIVLTRFPDNFL
jgi:hypothetical protein